MLQELVHGRTVAREGLEQKYAPYLRDRLDYGRQVTYVPNKNEPIYGWFKYKEAFSRKLATDLLLQQWQMPQGAIVFDPFAGCGTTLLACKQLGYKGLGLDIMPLAVFIARTKLNDYPDVELIEQEATSLLNMEFVPVEKSWPNVRIINLALDPGTQDEILFLREEILKVENRGARDFLMLALLASIEEASYTAKDGQFLRLVTRHPRRIRDVLGSRMSRMLHDLRLLSVGGDYRESGRGSIYLGDARELPDELRKYEGSVSAVITSPPYLNRYDYSRTYSLELCLMYDEHGKPCVEDFEDLRNIRHSLLRSHIESRPATTHLVQVEALAEILENLRPKHLNNARIPIMIEGYFEDMNLVIRNLAQMLEPGGRVALVVANARFEGELIPVDLLLSEIASSHGLRTERIWVTRYKGNSSQQMGKYGRVPVRESIVFWSKN
ncbi:MAG: hypothetical protein HYY02_07210 [Chloroflexi bacterium]|nr:hypothetical protein [Chloroflexota bacterium]